MCSIWFYIKTQKPKISVFIKKKDNILLHICKKARLPLIKSVLVYVTRLLEEHTQKLDGFLKNCKFNEYIQSQCCVKNVDKMYLFN